MQNPSDKKPKPRAGRGASGVRKGRWYLESFHNGAEDVTDGRTQEGQNRDNDDGDQHQDERVLDQTLTFLTW